MTLYQMPRSATDCRAVAVLARGGAAVLHSGGGGTAMNQDALAALLCEGCPNAMRVSDGACILHLKKARRLSARGVVILPPAVAEVLRTGEPSEAMIRAAIERLNEDVVEWAVSDPGPDEDELMGRVLHAALAVLLAPTQRPT